MPLRSLLLAALALAAIAPSAGAQTGFTAWHPTCKEAHQAAISTMGAYASNLDGRLVLGPCAKRGRGTTVTRVRIVGGYRPERFRVLVTGYHDEILVRARPA
jgi:hypothetical protein